MLALRDCHRFPTGPQCCRDFLDVEIIVDEARVWIETYRCEYVGIGRLQVHKRDVKLDAGDERVHFLANGGLFADFFLAQGALDLAQDAALHVVVVFGAEVFLPRAWMRRTRETWTCVMMAMVTARAR